MRNQFTEKKILHENCRIRLALLRTYQRPDPVEAARERTRLAMKTLCCRTRKIGTEIIQLTMKNSIDTSIFCM